MYGVCFEFGLERDVAPDVQFILMGKSGHEFEAAMPRNRRT